MRTESTTIWEKLAECVATLPEPFRAAEIMSWFRRHYPEVNERSIRPHIQGATSNVSIESRGPFAHRRPLITRIGHGVYVRADAETAPTAQAEEPRRPDLVLVTCVKSKASHPAPARELYTSPLFLRQRRYAESSGVPWYILSAEHGLVGPDEWLAPYERYLPDTPRSYREAWGLWVVERLALVAGSLERKVVEVHASAEYVAAIGRHLTAKGATIVDPLRGLPQGRRLAWYHERADVSSSEPANGSDDLDLVDSYVAHLADETAAVSSADLDLTSLNGPGLYAWWVDPEGANDLSTGLGEDVEPGLIYAGLAGATRWPSGKRSGNTVAQRISRMHLGGRNKGSTLRRTLGSILAEANGWPGIDEPALTRWMNTHLRVSALTVEDADTLGRIERDVLERLDPPLNLKDVPPTELRGRLSHLRARHTRDRGSTRHESEGLVNSTEVEKLFARAMREVYDRAKAEAGYNATYFLGMLADLGPLATARQLLNSDKISEGFVALWERGRLDLTVEAVVLRREFVDLFTEEERDIARRRLAEYGFNV